MKINRNTNRLFYALSATLLTVTACQKSDLAGETATDASQVISVAATASAAEASDSVYLLQNCGWEGKRDSIAASALPANATAYLAAHYAGYTFHKAYAVKNSSGTITAYVAVIYFNGKPVGLAFGPAGNFQQVLEQREKGDLRGSGHHRGGRFEHRDGRGRDSIALGALPASVTAYFASDYAGDTLVKAFRSKDSSILVLSRNNGAFATLFSASGTFVSRTELQSRKGHGQPVDLSALPSIAANYLAQTYPNYVFKKAFLISQNGSVKGYVVVIDANNTKYAVEFDAAGQFVAAKTLR